MQNFEFRNTNATARTSAMFRCRRAAGGGSMIDGTGSVAAAVPCHDDSGTIMENHGRNIRPMPLSSGVLTVRATRRRNRNTAL